MRRTFLVGLLAAACAAAILAPEASAAKFSMTITKVEAYSDGNVSGYCVFHTKTTYTTTGHVPKGLTARSQLIFGTPSGGGYQVAAISEELGASPFNSGAMITMPSNSYLSSGGTYYFAVSVLNGKSSGVAASSTSTFSLYPATYVNGCPAASGTPLATTPTVS